MLIKKYFNPWKTKRTQKRATTKGEVKQDTVQQCTWHLSVFDMGHKWHHDVLTDHRKLYWSVYGGQCRSLDLPGSG